MKPAPRHMSMGAGSHGRRREVGGQQPGSRRAFELRAQARSLWLSEQKEASGQSCAEPGLSLSRIHEFLSREELLSQHL